MVLSTDPVTTKEYQRRFSQDPKSFVDYPFDVVYSLDPATLDTFRLLLAQQKFAFAKDNIKLVGHLAAQSEVTAIEHFNDLLPLLYNQESFKGYPQSWLETGDFKRLTRWLGKLCAVDLSAVDASSCESIEDWIKVLSRQSSVDLLVSAGADGKAAFLPRTKDEWAIDHSVSFWNFQSSMGDSHALRPGIDKVPLIYPGARSGARSWGRFLDFYEATFGNGLVDAPYGYNDSDLLSLAGRIRDASKKGEAGLLQINPSLLSRKEEIARINSEKPQQMEALMQRMINDYRGQRIVFYGSMQLLYDLALRFKQQGVTGAYTSDSFFFCGGGFSDGKQPANWKQEVTAALGVQENAIRVGYGMQEGIWAMQLCSHGNYHVPVTMIPFVLDQANGQPLPRSGKQTGRFAFFDLLPETSWGGYITSDQITIDWDEPCACGHKGAYLNAAVSKVVEKQDDKIGCAGTDTALEDATDFLLKS